MTIKKLTVIMAAGAVLLAGAIGAAMQLTNIHEVQIEGVASEGADGTHTLRDMEHIPLYYAESERLLLPLRSVIEGLGGSVIWDGASGETEIAYGGRKLRLRAGEENGSLNGYEVTLPAQAEVINGCLYADERLLSAYYTDEVTFDIEARQVRLKAKDFSQPILAQNKVKGEQGGRSYGVEVPVFLGLDDKRYEASLNGALRTELEGYGTDFLAAEEKTGFLHLRLVSGLQRADFFSLCWEGKADGQTVRMTRNIDLLGQKTVDLSDMLTKEALEAVQAEMGEAETAFYLTAEGRLVLLKEEADELALHYWTQPLTWKQNYQQLFAG